jgi:hypothetical protein
MHEPIVSLPELTPPPGGLERLQRRIAAGHGRRRREWAGLAVAASAAAMLALVSLPPWLQQQRTRGELARVVRQALQPVGPGELRVIDGAALALESGQSGVRLYLVQSTRGAPAGASR